MSSGKPTKAQTIAQTLADEIQAGRLAPGAPLDETEIAARYGVSRTPIREAIRQLTASGVLDTRAHRGAVVRSFHEQELDDMFAVMADLEGLCARGAAMAMTATELDAVAELLDEGAALVEVDDRAGYAILNDRFHETIYHGAHNAFLMKLTWETRATLAPYRRAQFATAGRLPQSHAEHRHVVDAIKARDPVLAFEAMRAHIVVVREAFDRAAEITPP